MPTAKLPYVDPVVTPDVLSGAWVGGARAGVAQTANRVAMAKAVLEAQTRAGIAAMEVASRNKALASQERLEASKQAADMQMFLRELESDTAARAKEFDNRKTLTRMEIEARKELQTGDPANKFKQMQMDALEQWDTASPEERETLSLRLAAGTSALGDQLGYQRTMLGMTGEADETKPTSESYWIRRNQGNLQRAAADRHQYEQRVVPAYQSAIQKATHWSEQIGSMEAMQEHARAVNELLEAEAALMSYWGIGEGATMPFAFDRKILTHVTQRRAEEAAVEAEDEREASNFNLLDTALSAPGALIGEARDVSRRGLAGYGLNVARRAIGAEQERSLREQATKVGVDVVKRGTIGLSKMLSKRLQSMNILEEETGPTRPGESVATNVVGRLPAPSGKGAIVKNPETGQYEVRQQ